MCAAGPIVFTTLRALADGWRPAGDQAIIATRAYDVFTSHTPLVGQHSDAGEVTHHAVYSLGPLLYWLLALPARFAGPGAMTLTIGIVNSAAIVGVVVLARRRGGRLLMLLTALAAVVMTRSLSPETLHDVWNASAGVFPFTLLIFLCWSLACGEYRLLPLTVLVASFAAQCQLAFLVPSLGALAVGVVGLAVSLRRPRGARGAWRWALAALLVAGACWVAPAINQIRGRPGNLTAVIDTAKANHSTLGATVGWRAVVLGVGVRPWWTTDPASPWQRKAEVRTAPGTLAVVSTVLALVALIGLAVVGPLRRRAELCSGALIALALCAGVGAIAASTPTTRLLSATLGYTLWLASPVGMFVWLMLLWPAFTALASIKALRRRVTPAPRRRRARVAFSLAGLGAVALLAAGVAAAERPDEHLSEYRPIGVISRALDRNVPRGATVRLVGALGDTTFRFKMAARFALVRRGVRPLSPGTDTRLGAWYQLDHHRYDCTVYVDDGHVAPVRGARTIASVPFRGTDGVSVWLSPGGCPAS